MCSVNGSKTTMDKLLYLSTLVNPVGSQIIAQVYTIQ